MMWKATWSHLTERFCRRPGLMLMSLPCVLLITLYFISESNIKFEGFQYLPFKTVANNDEKVNGYLVWSPKCHMLAKDPLDPSIAKFVKTVKFEACSLSPLLTEIVREANGSSVLVVDHELRRAYKDLSCCWATVKRLKPSIPLDRNIDSKISVDACVDFQNKVFLPSDVDVVIVTCREKRPEKEKKTKTNKKAKLTEVYKNVHPILSLEKVRDRLERVSSNVTNEPRKLSVLMLGIDSVSRLNFQRTMPQTESYLKETGWIGLKGYNKMGENTFPNLMAILTGQSQQQSYSKCKPTVSYGLDNCPMLWYRFRNVSYVTAYGEDEIYLNTFNYLKVGYVEPPTDYYLRPYVMATEKFLTAKKKFSAKYCTGPQLSVDRIFDFAVEFAQTFVRVPYFGFFWTNSVSHDSVNGPSSIDRRMLAKFKILERTGVLNDSMVVFLSDHGMRYGEVRDTLVGWYEERLPFIYIWLPEWFREQNHEAHAALRINGNRLTSPYDLYETLRDVLIRAGGEANASSGCSTCQTLFRPIPRNRGCEEAGVASHWCTCTAFKPGSTDDKIAILGVEKFLEHVENIVKEYKNPKGKRLCAKLKLKKLFRVDQVLDLSDNMTSDVIDYFYMLQVTPGDGKFEMTIRYHENGTLSISDDTVSRINSYASSSQCLDHGDKRYCHCVK